MRYRRSVGGGRLIRENPVYQIESVIILLEHTAFQGPVAHLLKIGIRNWKNEPFSKHFYFFIYLELQVQGLESRRLGTVFFQLSISNINMENRTWDLVFENIFLISKLEN